MSLTLSDVRRSYRVRAYHLVEPTLLWAHRTQVQSKSPKNCMETWGLVQLNLPHAAPGPCGTGTGHWKTWAVNVMRCKKKNYKVR